ncbi:hypothetical protein ROA7450_03067 [Roseovarius albus]|uniref:Right handed beta helix domain-containing protein n=1 Tax=Roseovarius albus TaxID=1247867 RepID=A0A1X6ZRF7_9RHOB|nr:right-handed parallel beta-helix repeat-containing protein [Roseovarius albus]SLN59277.1 hypothetical protein ROA7450_03067 [Roseovarius albus]
MTIFYSSDLGWKAGQDITKEFAAIANSFKPGDTFVFDAMYDISGSNIEIPENFTLKGSTPGAGFNVTDTDANSRPLLELSDGTSLVDLTVTHESSSSGKSNKVTIKAAADDVTILNSSFSGNTGIFIDVTGDNLLVEDTHFDGAYYQMRWLGDNTNHVVKNTLFENALGDGLKTARGDGEGTINATIIDSVFLNNERDGIDTTGGFKDSSVIDSYFVGNGVSALDIKTPIWEKADLSLDQTARNITITGSEFINNGGGSQIILTTNDRAELLNNSNARDWIVQDVYISDSIFENTGSTSKNMVLARGASGIHAEDVTFLGKIKAYQDVVHSAIDHVTIDLNTDLTISNVTYGDPRKGTLDVDYAGMAGPDWSEPSVTPPKDETPAPDPEPETPDPTPTPPEEPTDPAPDDEASVGDTTVTSASSLLNFYLADASSDKTISQLGDSSNIDSSLTNGKYLTLYATSQDGGPNIGSVKLSIDGFGSRMENVEPFALFGDNGKGDFFGSKELSEGTYTAEVTVYEGRSGKGDVLETVSFEFTVGGEASTPVVTPTDPIVDDPVDPVVADPVEPDPDPVDVVEQETDLAPDVISQVPYSQLLNLQLIDTTTDQVLVDMNQGAKLSSDDLEGRYVTLSAEAINPDVGIGSVKIEFDGQHSRIENVEPYALFGDNGKGNFYGGEKIDDGIHTATLTVYSGRGGKGSVLEEVTLNFEVGDYDSVLIDGSSTTISSYSASQDTGTATVTNAQKTIQLEDSAWKTMDVSMEITESTVLEFDFKSDAEGEIQGIALLGDGGDLESRFFQLDGSQVLGIQDFNEQYDTGSGFNSYSIKVGEYFTGRVDQLVLVSDDDAGVGALSTFEDISFI